MVEADQVVALDVVNIGVFDGPAIRSVAAVNDIAEFAFRNAAGIVIAARDFAARLGLR